MLRKKEIVLQCLAFDDGLGDISNLIELAGYFLKRLGTNQVHLNFVITGESSFSFGTTKTPQEAYELALKRFYEEAEYSLKEYGLTIEEIKEGTSSFITQYRSEAEYGSYNPDDYGKFKDIILQSATSQYTYDRKYRAFAFALEEQPKLQQVYLNADMIVSVPTYFPPLPKKLFDQLKENVQLINVTEHGASSYTNELRNSHLPYHFVTGFAPWHSGLMLTDAACNFEQAVTILQSMTDRTYFEKIGLPYPVSTPDAKRFLTENLIVPVYLGTMQKNLLPILVQIVSQSPLARAFKKIFFHVNGRSYEEKTYQAISEKMTGGVAVPTQLIVSHFFQNPQDYSNLYKLYSGRGLAIISSDKVLEMAISCNLLPIYPPVPWKSHVYEDFLAHLGNSKLGELNTVILDKQAAKKYLTYYVLTPYPIDSLLAMVNENGPAIAQYLSQETIKAWQAQRQALLDNALFTHLDQYCLPFLDKETASSNPSFFKSSSREEKDPPKDSDTSSQNLKPRQ